MKIVENLGEDFHSTDMGTFIKYVRMDRGREGTGFVWGERVSIRMLIRTYGSQNSGQNEQVGCCVKLSY